MARTCTESSYMWDFLIKAVLEASRYYFVKCINKTTLLTKEQNVLSNGLGVQHPSPVTEFSNQTGMNRADRENKRSKI